VVVRVLSLWLVCGMRVLGCRRGLLLFCMDCCGEWDDYHGLECLIMAMNNVSSSISEQQHTVKVKVKQQNQ
jgi:hypothetical protein